MNESKLRLKWLETLLEADYVYSNDTFVRNLLKEVLHGEIPSWIREGNDEHR